MPFCYKNMYIFFHFVKIFSASIFLFIGFKTGKPSGIGEKIRVSKPESGKWKKSKKSLAR